MSGSGSLKFNIYQHERWYFKRGREVVGDTWDKSISQNKKGMNCLIENLDKYDCKTVLELGCGFSTIALRAWEREADVRKVISAEHNEDWVAALKGLLTERDIQNNDIYLLSEIKDQYISLNHGVYDAVFIDHGPTMRTRLDDLPWAASLLNDNGILFLDDWRTEHVGKKSTRWSKKAKAILSRMGFEAEVLEDSRSAQHERAICMARRY
jgi:predicted O-methyltransferase YrrM